MLLAQEPAADQNQDPNLKAAPPTPAAAPCLPPLARLSLPGEHQAPQGSPEGIQELSTLGAAAAGWGGMSSPLPSPLLPELTPTPPESLGVRP